MDIMEKNIEKAAERAVSYINIKPRTAYQVKKYLKDKGYEEDVIAEVTDQLKEYRYIDDMEFSLMYFRYGFEKGRGVSRIKRELSEKGVSSDIIDIAYEELEDIPDQFEMAMEIGHGAVAGIDIKELDFDTKQKLKAKIGRRLMSRGFSSDVVYKVIGRLID
ncbi:MAG: regulatory protein RecX [Bacillota bacterium]|nr:regulatory protein RecX [Bacillota bacterium]